MVITSLSIATFLPYRFLKAAKSIHVPFLVLSIQIVRVIRSCIFNFVRKRLNLIRNYGWEDEKDKFSFCILLLCGFSQFVWKLKNFL